MHYSKGSEGQALRARPLKSSPRPLDRRRAWPPDQTAKQPITNIAIYTSYNWAREHTEETPRRLDQDIRLIIAVSGVKFLRVTSVRVRPASVIIVIFFLSLFSHNINH